MTEIRCQKCNRCLSKGIAVGTGFYYINPDREMIIFQEEIKCPNCGAMNELTVSAGIHIIIREKMYPSTGEWNLKDLYST